MCVHACVWGRGGGVVDGGAVVRVEEEGKSNLPSSVACDSVNLGDMIAILLVLGRGEGGGEGSNNSTLELQYNPSDDISSRD